MTTFGERLRDCMLVACVSISAVARQCKVSRQTVEKWLAMRQAKLSGVHLELLCAALNCRVRWLVTGAGLIEHVNTDGEFNELAQILRGIAPDEREAWMEIGRLLAKKKRVQA